MYGHSHLNAAGILKYAWTYEFFQAFQKLQYRGIELPSVMLRPFLNRIRPDVDLLRHDAMFVALKQHTSNLTEYRDVQRKLIRPVQRSQHRPPGRLRPTLLLPGALYPFAVRHLRNDRVLFLLSGKNDRKLVAGWRTHRNFDIFDFRKAVLRTRIPAASERRLDDRLKLCLNAATGHEQFAKAGFYSWMSARMRKTARYVKVLDQLLRQHPIAAIVHFNELDPPGNILASLARKYNLPFLFVQMHMLSDISVTPAQASRYLVWGDYYKQWFVNKGIDPDIVHSTGSIGLEALARTNFQTRRSVRRKLNIPDHHLLVLWTTQSFNPATNQQLLRWFRHACNELPVTVVIRPHPSDKLDYNRQVTGRPFVVCPPAVSLIEMMKESDLVATISSTTAIEAALLGKGLLILQPRIPYHFYKNYNDFHRHLVRASAGKAIYHRRHLRLALYEWLNKPQSKKKLDKMRIRFLASTLNMQTSPTKRIVSLIKPFVRHQQPAITRKSRRR